MNDLTNFWLLSNLLYVFFDDRIIEVHEPLRKQVNSLKFVKEKIRKNAKTQTVTARKWTVNGEKRPETVCQVSGTRRINYTTKSVVLGI